MISRVSVARGVVALAAALWMTSCAQTPPGKAPASAGTGEKGEVAPGGTGTATTGGDVDAKASELRARIANTPPETSAGVRLRLAQTLESAGRYDAALVEYLWLTGSSGRPEESAAAWDAVARVSRHQGDEAGAVRAEMKALDASGSSERGPREAALKESFNKLKTPDARRLAREAGGTDAGAFARRELSTRAPSSETVIALLLPLSGRFESFGRAFRLGAELALRQRDAAQPSARRVRLSVSDAGDDLLGATHAVRAAILEEGATAVIGPLLSVPALGAGSIADAFGVPLIAPTATDPDLRRVGPHVITLEPSAWELAEPLAHVAVDILGGRRFGALVAREAAAEEREHEFRAAVERRGAEVSLTVAYDPGERDFRKYLDLLKEAAPDAVYVPGEANELEALVPQLEFYDFDRRILGHGGWTSPRVRQPGLRALEGAILTVEAADDPASPFAKRLQKAVQATEGAEPTRFHVRGAQAMEAVLFALDHGATDPEALSEALRLRTAWTERPEGEEIRLLTIRGGSLIAANPESLAVLPAAVDSMAASMPGGG